MPTDPITTAQAAERLRCDVSTINRMARDGRLAPALKFPGERGPYMFERADVERLAVELAREHAAKAADLTAPAGQAEAAAS